MSGNRGSVDTIFTIFTAVCAATLAIVFIAIGSVTAKATFSPHPGHADESGQHH